MTQNQITARIQAVFEFPDQFSLRFPVKINHGLIVNTSIGMITPLWLSTYLWRPESRKPGSEPYRKRSSSILS